MIRSRLSRRLLAGLAGLTLGLTGAAAAMAPAQATSTPEATEVFYNDACHGTYVLAIGGSEQATYRWSIATESGEHYWPPLDDSVETPAGETIMVFVPHEAGKIITTYEGAPAGWPREHTWERPIVCGELPEPSATAGSCDTDAQITIPELPFSEGPRVRPSASPQDPEPVQPTNVQAYAGLPSASAAPQEPSIPPGEGSGEAPEPPNVPAPTDPDLGYRLDGEDVEPGSTHTVEPGTHYVDLMYSDVPFQTWEIEIPEPECEDAGEGGELPVTGTTATLIAAGAVLLLALGTGAYLIARRRRVTFTA